jgi:hypothetical protein
LNVPGPFFTGETDNCWTGRLHAPRNVIYGGKYFTEYVFRQPRDADEVAGLVDAAEADPLQGYAYDGDDHWTPEAVRAWWHGRQHVVEGLTATLELLDTEHELEHDAAQGLRDYLAYLENGLENDLRAYVFRLETGRYPLPGEQLPELG